MPKVSQAHLDARRTQILDAATACFARSGIRETTIQDICTEAELSPGAIYRYFKSKQEILHAVFDRHIVKNRQLPRALEDADDPMEGIASLVRSMFASIDAPELVVGHRLTLMVHSESARDPAVAERYSGVLADVIDRFADVISALQADGKLRDDFDGRSFCWLLTALYEGTRILKVIDADIDTAAMSDLTWRMVSSALVSKES